MKRFDEATILEWFQREIHKPLVIRGARQVGKSTLVRQFAKNNNRPLHEINLEKNPQLEEVFKRQNIREIINELEFITQKGKIIPGESILFLDEIQSIPHALQNLRYFYEDIPALHVIAAGSLLEFTLATHSFSMPVGRIEYLYMYPVSFFEYLNACNETHLLDILRNYTIGDYFPISVHEKCIHYQGNYILAGGMPEALQILISENDLERVFNVQSQILETYRDDFAKYASGNELLRIQKIYDFIPSGIGQKMKYVNIDPHVKARELKKAYDLLVKAGLIIPAYHSDASGIPLKATKDEKVYKSFFLDIGLINRSCGIEYLPLDILKSVKFINEGKLAEQFIAQHLLTIGRKNEKQHIFYWLREGRRTNAEVDFLIQKNSEIFPIEVKAGKTGTLKSIHQFIFRKKSKCAVRFDLNLPRRESVEVKIKQPQGSQEVEFKLLSLPLYMVEMLPTLLSKSLK
ncbi:MAG: ATP-binding protein [bacterium]